MRFRMTRFISAMTPLLLIATSFGLRAQPASPSTQNIDKTAVDVISVKPNNSGGTSMSFSAQADEIRAENVSVLFLLQNAYDMRDDQVLRLPNWVRSERYDVAAKILPDRARSEISQQEQSSMIRQLLASRFGVEAHYETRDGNVFFLVVGKSGVKLIEQPGGGSVSGAVLLNRGRIYGQAMSMQSFADQLSLVTQKEVIDHTKLTGRYQIDLVWASDENMTVEGGQAGTTAPSLYTAIQEQLGLKVVPGKGKVKVLVIDQVRRPEPN